MMIEFDTIYKISPNYRTDGGGDDEGRNCGERGDGWFAARI